MTVTTTDDRLSRFLEVRAPMASRRLATLAALHARGIRTYAFVGPLLPHFRYESGALDDLFRRLAETGVRSVYVEHINLSAYIRRRLSPRLASESSAVKAVYAAASTDEHRAALDAIVRELVDKHGLALRHQHVLRHSTRDHS